MYGLANSRHNQLHGGTGHSQVCNRGDEGDAWQAIHDITVFSISASVLGHQK